MLAQTEQACCIEFFLSITIYQVGGMRTNCYLIHTAKKVNIELAIWDTAGQEKFHCISTVSVSVPCID